ncbi:MAG: adhesin [Hyphomicrobium sp.]|nr:adhesin [Hyphomicrobium sp.]
MCACEAGVKPVRNYRGLSARAAVAVLLAALGGCASDQHASDYTRAHVAMAQATIDIEDDGLPAQSPPSKAVRHAPDDPSEPYSRNYGGINPSVTGVPAAAGPAPQQHPVPDIPDDLPPAFRQKLVTAMTSED